MKNFKSMVADISKQEFKQISDMSSVQLQPLLSECFFDTEKLLPIRFADQLKKCEGYALLERSNNPVTEGDILSIDFSQDGDILVQTSRVRQELLRLFARIDAYFADGKQM